jgi:hypothetical protein
MPNWVSDGWDDLKRDLLATGDNWEAWTTWYEERVFGYTPNTTFEVMRVVEVPDAAWDAGPLSANNFIQQLDLFSRGKTKPNEGDPPDPKDSITFQRWLSAKPREWAALIAVRAALRKLGTLRSSPGDATLLSIFRAISASRYAALNPESSKVARDAAEFLRERTTQMAIAAFYAASAAGAEDAASRAVTIMSDTGLGYDPTGDPAIVQDALWLVEGRSAREVARAPLWHGEVPPDMPKAWLEFAGILRANGKHWQVWVDWYNYVFEGSPPSILRNDVWEAAFVGIPKPLPWDAGAQSVNTEIAARLDHISRFLPSKKQETVEQIAQGIEESSSSAPLFILVEGRLRYKQATPIDQIGERRTLVEERLFELQSLCDLRANEQPKFKRLVEEYGAALSKIESHAGAYRLFLAGFDIETFLKIKSHSMPDRERNPPLDADQLFATQSLIVAHAGLITLFPDIQSVATELDRYRQMSESLDALRDRILDPVFQQLLQAAEIFDNDTLAVASEIQIMDQTATNAGVSITQGAASVKHSWIRGALAAIGQYVLKQGREISKVARDAAVKESVVQVMKHPDQLVVSMVTFLAESKSILLSLANKLQAQFGWIASLLSHLGL